ncbi:MFS transporter, partial [Staphylococcus pseudintermedius]
TVEYKGASVCGGIGFTISMLFISKMLGAYSTCFMYSVIYVGFTIYGLANSVLTVIQESGIPWIIALFLVLLYG